MKTGRALFAGEAFHQVEPGSIKELNLKARIAAEILARCGVYDPGVSGPNAQGRALAAYAWTAADSFFNELYARSIGETETEEDEEETEEDEDE